MEDKDRAKAIKDEVIEQSTRWAVQSILGSCLNDGLCNEDVEMQRTSRATWRGWIIVMPLPRSRGMISQVACGMDQ